jgi:hypothetical protein
MLFSRKSVVAGMSPYPGLRGFLSRLAPHRPQFKQPLDHGPTFIFSAKAQIQHTAGGLYGDEFRPD